MIHQYKHTQQFVILFQLCISFPFCFVHHQLHFYVIQLTTFLMSEHYYLLAFTMALFSIQLYIQVPILISHFTLCTISYICVTTNFPMLATSTQNNLIFYLTIYNLPFYIMHHQFHLYTSGFPYIITFLIFYLAICLCSMYLFFMYVAIVILYFYVCITTIFFLYQNNIIQPPFETYMCVGIY